MYYYNYEKKCYDVECDSCVKKLLCLHYTPDPDGPAWESDENNYNDTEYRLFVSTDDNTNLLINNIADIILKRTGITDKSFKKEVIRIVKVWYHLGYQVRDLLSFGDFYSILNIYYKYILPILSDTIKQYFQSCLLEYYQHNNFTNHIESSSVDLPISARELQEIIESLSEHDEISDDIIDLWITLKTYHSFNGYVKIVPEQEHDQEDYLDEKILNLNEEAYRLIKEIFLLQDGKKAYEKSQRLKSILSEMRKANAVDLVSLHKNNLKKVWDLRKKHKCCVEEKIKIFQKEFGY